MFRRLRQKYILSSISSAEKEEEEAREESTCSARWESSALCSCPMALVVRTAGQCSWAFVYKLRSRIRTMVASSSVLVAQVGCGMAPTPWS